MDILNWLRIKKQNLIRTTLDSPKDLVVLGADVSYQKRGDKYQSYAMPAEDFLATARPYKVYTASLTQIGTDPATVIVLENTIDPGITINAQGNGNFEIISPLNAFTLNQTVGFPVMFGDDTDSPLLSYMIFSDPSGGIGSLIARKIDGTLVNVIGDDNSNLRCPIEIRVYN